jgi:glycosyltransferase involved in cell wall biosynthesis
MVCTEARHGLTPGLGQDCRKRGRLVSLRNIAYLTPLYFDEKSNLGGGERYPLNLAIGVVHASRGSCRVELISYGPESFRTELQPGLSLRVLRAANRPVNPLDTTSWELPGAIDDADLVHLHMPFTRSNEFALIAAKQQHKPICVTDHGGKSSILGQNLDILQLVDHILPNSDFAASLLRIDTPITVIKGGVDGDRFSPAPGERALRDRVLFVGRFLPHKGIDQLIEAMPPDVLLTICGRPYDATYHAHLRERATGKKVEFVTDGDDAAILDLYRRAFALVLPSVYRDCYGTTHAAPELMGFTLLEAMACGTPAICSRVGGMPEYVRDGETGFVYDTVDELSARLQLLAADWTLADRMGRRARHVIEAEYDLKVAGRKTLDVYRALMAKRREEAA